MRTVKSKQSLKKVLTLHGPNLNLLGEREPSVYGTLTLEEINIQLRKWARLEGLILKIFQSNHEGVLIDLIHRYRNWADGLVIIQFDQSCLTDNPA